MIRQGTATLLAALGMFLGIASANAQTDQADPPIRLQKKGKPSAPVPAQDGQDKKLTPEDRKPETPPKDERQGRPKPDEEPEPPAVDQEDEKEIVSRLGKNLRSVEDQMANNEVGERTKNIQQDIVKDLDQLIARQMNPQQQQQQQQQQDGQSQDQQAQNQQGQRGQQGQQSSGSQTSGRSQQQQGQQGSQSQGNRQGQQQGRRGQGGQQQQQGQRGQSNSQQGQQPNRGGQPGNNPDPNSRPGEGVPPGGAEPRKDTDRNASIWGHLPEAKRAEMDAYAREKFMAKYKELINQYYATLAEKSRQKGGN